MYKMDNQFKELEKFWENLQSKDKFKFNLSTNEKGLYSNYLPPLLTLYKMKIINGELDKSLKIAIEYIANVLGKNKEVQSIIKQYEKGG